MNPSVIATVSVLVVGITTTATGADRVTGCFVRYDVFLQTNLRGMDEIFEGSCQRPSMGMVSASESTQCLQYDKPVALTGTMSMHKTKYGTDMPASASGRPYAVLTLDTPICASGPDEKTEDSVMALHIIDTCRRAWPRGSRARISGDLFHANTVHHQTPVLIFAKQVKRLDGRTPACKE
jgi:hypothetical protein